jgi:hypothetical protein
VLSDFGCLKHETSLEDLKNKSCGAVKHFHGARWKQKGSGHTREIDYDKKMQW